MINNMRGGSTFGCLFMAAVLAAAIYVGLMWGYAQWDYEGMKEELTLITKHWSQASRGLEEEAVKRDVIYKADKIGLEIFKEDVEVSITSTHVTIDMWWDVPIEFPGYTYVREYHLSKSMRRLGR